VSPPPVETTTTTTAEQPATAQPERLSQEVPPAEVTPPAASVLPRQELPRTGADANPARIAAGALSLALLGHRGTRRRARLRRR
jgi:hypothetical protein